MVEKHARTRSKSASRRRNTRSQSKNKRIDLELTKNSVKIDSTNQAESSESFYEAKQILIDFPKKETMKSNYQDDELNSIKGIYLTECEIILNDLKNDTINQEKDAESKMNGLLCILILVFIPMVLLFNKMCENGGMLRYIQLTEIKLKYFFNLKYIGIILGWLIYLGLLANIPIGKIIKMKSKDGSERKLRCNGFFSLIISALILSILLYTKFPVKIFFDDYYFLIGSSTTLAFSVSFLMVLKYYFSTKPKFLFCPGSVINTFIFGRDTNQRLFGVDLKFFYEVRPGYISWALINALLCFQDWQDNEFRSLNIVLALSASAQIIYCMDSLIFESDLITKSFIENSQFGFYHCFGNQVVVPFFFTLTSRSIQMNKYIMPYNYLGGVFLLNFLGYIIFRSSNIQKNSFHSNPYSVHLCHLKTFTNHYGHQLLAGGWWGLLRHPNYLGDILMIFSWSLYSGVHFSACWVFPVYYLCFMITRCIQAEKAFSKEHGATWDLYRKYVPYRIIPFIF